MVAAVVGVAVVGGVVVTMGAVVVMVMRVNVFKIRGTVVVVVG